MLNPNAFFPMKWKSTLKTSQYYSASFLGDLLWFWGFYFYFFILISFPFSSLSFYHTKLYRKEERYSLCLTELLISCSTALQFKSFKSYRWKVVNSRQTKYESIVMTATTWDNIAIPLPCLSGVKNI